MSTSGGDATDSAQGMHRPTSSMWNHHIRSPGTSPRPQSRHVAVHRRRSTLPPITLTSAKPPTSQHLLAPPQKHSSADSAVDLSGFSDRCRHLIRRRRGREVTESWSRPVRRPPSGCAGTDRPGSGTPEVNAVGVGATGVFETSCGALGRRSRLRAGSERDDGGPGRVRGDPAAPTIPLQQRSIRLVGGGVDHHVAGTNDALEPRPGGGIDGSARTPQCFGDRSRRIVAPARDRDVVSRREPFGQVSPDVSVSADDDVPPTRRGCVGAHSSCTNDVAPSQATISARLGPATRTVDLIPLRSPVR